MELRKKNLHMMQKKSEAQNQITFDEDYNVPDQKADIGQIIQKKGEVEIEQVQVSEGKAVIQGQLIFRLLYVADNPGKTVSSLEGKLPIEETLHLDKVQSGDKVCLKWEIEDLTIHLINSRKLNVKAIVEFLAVVDEEKQISIPVELKGEEEISAKKKTIRVLTLGVHKKDTLRKKEEITIASNKPNIHQILWKDIQVRGLEMRAQEGKVTARGELSVFVLYVSDDEANPLQWLEQTMTFSGELSCTGCTMDMIPYIDTTMLQSSLEIKPDADGEERVVRNAAKCRVSDRISVEEAQGKILQICHGEGSVKVDSVHQAEHGIQVEGIVQVRILYSISDDEMPFYSMETVIPFSQMIKGEQVNGQYGYQLQADLEQLSMMMLDSSEIEVKVVLNLNALLVMQWEEDLIQEIQTREPDQKKLEELPGIVCYVVQPRDTLWDIAKMFYTTMEAIRKLNDLGEGEVKPRQTLLVVKNSGCN